MLETVHQLKMISESETIILERITAVVIYNNGQVSLNVAGRTVLPGCEYRFPVDGSVSDFSRELIFAIDTAGLKSAVIEYKQVKRC